MTMTKIGTFIFCFALFFSSCSLTKKIFAPAGSQPREITLQQNFVSAEGWRGQAYFSNGIVTYQQLDTKNNDDRYDRWRFYKDGIKIREEADLNRDDIIDLVYRYHPESGDIIFLERDRNFDGKMDVRIKYQTGRRWRQQIDRNHDGNIDFLLDFHHPVTLFTDLKLNSDRLDNLRQLLPQNCNSRLCLDQDHDGILEQIISKRKGHEVVRILNSGKKQTNILPTKKNANQASQLNNQDSDNKAPPQPESTK